MTGDGLGFSFILWLYHFLPTILLLAPSVALAAWARSRLPKMTGGPLTPVPGARAARRLLEAAEVADGIEIVPASGPLASYYDPRRKELRLAEFLVDGRTMACVALALHEAGHAIQDVQGYRPLVLRWPLVLAAGIGSRAGWLIVLAGVAMDFPGLAFRGALLVFAAVVAAVALLPIEFDANARVRRALVGAGLDEFAAHPAFTASLSAAAWDPIAATLPFSTLPASTALVRTLDPGPLPRLPDDPSPASRS